MHARIVIKRPTIGRLLRIGLLLKKKSPTHTPPKPLDPTKLKTNSRKRSSSLAARLRTHSGEKLHERRSLDLRGAYRARAQVFFLGPYTRSMSRSL
jgi:hypothetical protein